MKNAFKMLLIGFLFSVSTLVNAEEFKIENPYIQLSGGVGFKSGETDAAAKFAVGLDLNKRFAVEGGSVDSLSLFATDYDTLYLSLVIKHALSEKLSLAGKIGITSWESTYQFLGPVVEESGTSGMAGLDLKYDFSKKWAALLSAEYFGGPDIFPVTVGLRYTF